MNELMKTCSKCGEVKPLDGFYKNRSTLDGFTYQCKKCTNDGQKKYIDVNRDRRNEAGRNARALRTPEQISIDKEKAREKNKRHLYGKKNWEKIKSNPVLLEKKRQYEREDRERKFIPTLLPRKPRSDKQPIDVFLKKRKWYAERANELLLNSIVVNRIIYRTNIDRRLIPKELIEARRAHIQIGRKLKELKA